MPPLPIAAGVVTAVTGAIVLVAWGLGFSGAASLVQGWRVMVPSTAFCMVCAGAGLMLASTLESDRAAIRLAVRLLAIALLVLPVATLFEYTLNTRFGVESWLGVTFDGVNPYAGRMSAMTSTCFVMLGVALAALTWPGRWAARVVRLAGGAALAMSWLAVLAVSFDSTRIIDAPRFPGMAALTIILVAVVSGGVLACSAQAVRRLRDADADLDVPRWLPAAAFLLPLALGRAGLVLERWIDPGLAAAIISVIFAVCVTMVVWRSASRMQELQHQRQAALAELEARVSDRTYALADANEQLRRSEERLREADRRKDEFLATLAHELRNLLAPIRTSIQLLKTGASDASRAQSHLLIDRQIAHMVRLIDDLLDVSRITADKLKLRQDHINLIDVMHQAVESSRAAVERGRHTLTVHVPPEPMLVVGDHTRLTQVVANLLQNACKYTPAGGEIVLTAAAEGSRAEIRVRDNGIGIPAEFQPHLFEKFAQMAPALDRSQGGLGLGLALVRGLVTLHGGSVELCSEGAGRGSEFIVRLPRAAEGKVSAMPAPTQATAVERPCPGRKVLVADDNDDNTTALALLLRQRGHVVETAGDGEEAYKIAERFRPDVVLLDLGMPKADGFDVCRRIRAQAWGRRVRVIAQTGWGQAHDIRRCEEAGFDQHLVKPIDPSTLEALLRG